MKLVKAYLHHVRTAVVVEALADAGFRNVTLVEVKGMLRPLGENEREYASESGGPVISEIELALVVQPHEVDTPTSIIRTLGRIGAGVSGYVHVSTLDAVLPIGGDK